MTPSARLTVTLLEDRTVPAGFGNAWIDTNLTVSFVPDGTNVDGAPSALFATLGEEMSTSTWQAVVRDAFQQWVVPANLNAGFVSDDGRALGSPGPVQGSPAVGDIRISARPLSDNVLAISNPFDLVSPWSGEIILNSNKEFGSGAYDLKTVLLHEIGHVLGVDDSADPNSVMYASYTGPRTGLSSGDVAAITALYGPRSADRYEGFWGNDTITTATPLKYTGSVSLLAGLDPAADATRYVAEGDLRTATDMDIYKVALPKEKVTVLVQTGGVSRAQLRVALLDATGKELASTKSYNATTGQYKLAYTPQAAGDFYVSVRTASGKALEVGSYRLAVGKGLTTVPTSALSTRIQSSYFGYDARPDWVNGTPSNDTFDKAQWLGVGLGSTNARWDDTGAAGIDTAADIDVYAVSTAWSPQPVLMVAVWSETSGPAPLVEVYDKDRNRVSGVDLLRNGSSTIVQIEGVKAWSTYYVVMKSANPAAWTGRESYRFGVDFRDTAVTLNALADGTLTAAQPQLKRQIEVTRSQVFRFQLAATGGAAEGARFTVFDATGRAVLTMVAQSGQTVIRDTLLAPGVYTIVVVGGTSNKTALKSLRVSAHFLTLTDPIGPALADEYAAPAPLAPADSPLTTLTAPSPEPTGTDGYFWLAPATLGSGFLTVTNPYSFVWW